MPSILCILLYNYDLCVYISLLLTQIPVYSSGTCQYTVLHKTLPSLQ